ncbi:GroES-like protein [Hypoxylon rubiginosum]|uniref:GroES-like protein n=1 Tax=Hypoxylon rubiginosum TaxID=110542 RepID=A0ACC0CX81_9PEZI|nr:GroES-like protein [Hypoxylon rubiginosum]
MSVNRVLWQDKPGVPGVIREDPIPTQLEDRQVLVKVRSWALNPADAILQDQSLGHWTYPLILGQDVAGTVEAVGSIGASKFDIGDRVFGFSVNNGFKDYVTLDHTLTAKIPESVSFSEACVFPLCITTASFALFGKDYLGLPLPSLNPMSTGKTILVWGGSSAVGSNGIQLAKAAGFDVVAACSSRNFDYVKNLGARAAFDYNSPSAINDIVAELDKGTCAGIYIAAGDAKDPCLIAHMSKDKPFVASSIPIKPGDAPEGVNAKMVFGKGGIDQFEETLPVTFGGFLPEALAKCLYKIAPSPEIVSTKGLEGIQEALDILKKGVSAKKLVVEG